MNSYLVCLKAYSQSTIALMYEDKLVLFVSGRMQQLPELAVQWPVWRRYGGILSQMEVGDPWATAGQHEPA